MGSGGVVLFTLVVWLRWVCGGFSDLDLVVYGFGDYGFGGCVCLVFDFCGLVRYSAYCLGDFWFLWFLAGLSLFALVVVSSAVVLCCFLGFEFW